MTPEEFRERGHQIIDWIADYRARIETLPVMPGVSPGDIVRSLPVEPPRTGESIDAILGDLDRIVMPGITHWQHPRFFGYFPGNASLASVLGDIASTGLGVVGLSWQSSPALTELEEVALDWLRQMLGLPEGLFGVIQDTASASTLVALAAAREADDEWALATALWWLAFFWVFDHDRLDLAGPYLDELAAVARRSNPYWFGWHGVVGGMAALHQGRLDDARRALEEGVAQAHEFGDSMLEAYSIAWLTEVYVARGDYEAAAAVAAATTARLSRSLDECREQWIRLSMANLALACQDPDRARHHLDEVISVVQGWGIPYISASYNTILGRLAIEIGDVELARPAVEEVAAIAGRFESPWLLAGSHNLSGRLCRRIGDAPGAEDHHHRALAVAVESGLAGVAAETLERLASLAVDGDSWAEAMRLFGAGDALRKATGQKRWPLDQPRYDADLARLREVLGDDGFAQAQTEGAGLTLEDAAAYAARARGERKRRSTGWEALTRTELEVVALAAQGLTNAEIGTKLFITAGTAKVHLSHIFRKLGVANRAQLAAMAATRRITG